jgi:hypothetical protein
VVRRADDDVQYERPAGPPTKGRVTRMSIGAIGGGAAAVAWPAPSAAAAADPATQKAQAHAQADLLNALRGTSHGSMVAARVSDGAGVDLYM